MRIVERSSTEDRKMNAQQLKNAILQEAIEGRLVPQDPNDEPASILLKRIRAEKERLVKEGKLKKKDLEVKPISEDEIPFEIPESWEWCRIGDIFIHSSGKQQSSSNKKVGTLEIHNHIKSLLGQIRPRYIKRDVFFR